MKCVLGSAQSNIILESKEDNPTLYFSNLGAFALDLQSKGKNLMLVGDTFIFGFCAKKGTLDKKALEDQFKEKVVVKNQFGRKKKTAKNCQLISITSKKSLPNPTDYFKKLGYEVMEL